MKQLRPIGNRSGLCNRLRVILSYAGHPSRTVLWPRTTDCPCHWNDIIESIPGIHFQQCSMSRFNSSRPINKPRDQRNYTLNDIVPTSFIRLQTQVTRPPEDYAAVHVRRTDIKRVHKRFNVKPLTDEDYFNWFESTGLNTLYLATDNLKTQNAFRNRYGQRVKFFQPIQYYGSTTKPVRCTPVQWAMIDLYVCISAKDFLGTPHSSFTNEIKRARKCHIH